VKLKNPSWLMSLIKKDKKESDYATGTVRLIVDV